MTILTLFYINHLQLKYIDNRCQVGKRGKKKREMGLIKYKVILLKRNHVTTPDYKGISVTNLFVSSDY